MKYDVVIKKAFDILIEGKHFTRLKKVGEIFENFIFEKNQMETDNGGGRKRKRGQGKKRKVKKRKVEVVEVPKPKPKTKLWEGLSKTFIPSEIFIEIGLHIPYEDLNKFIKIDKDLNAILNKSNYFWWKKFKTEYEGYKFPKLVKDIKKGEDLSYDWKELTQRFFSKLKVLKESFNLRKNSLFDWIFYNRKVFKVGNELIIKRLMEETHSPFENHYRFFLKEYFKSKEKFDLKFLRYLINENSDFDNNFKILFSVRRYEGQIPDKKKLIFAYLKRVYKKYFYRTDSMLLRHIRLDKLYENEKELFFDNDFVKKAIKINGYILKYAMKANKLYASDKIFILEALKTCNVVFNDINPNLKFDENFIFKALEINPFILKFLPEKFKGDKNFVIAIMKKYKNVPYIENLFFDMGFNLRNDKEVVLHFFKYFETDIPLAGRELLNNLEFFYELIKLDKKNIREIVHAGEVVRGNLEFMKYATKIYLNLKDIGFYENPLSRITKELTKDFFLNLDKEDLKKYFTRYTYDIEKYILFYNLGPKLSKTDLDFLEIFQNLNPTEKVHYFRYRTGKIRDFLIYISEKLIKQ